MNQEQIEQMKRTYAWNNVSFDPERRMENFIREFEECEKDIFDLCNKYGVESQKIKEKHFKLAMEYLNSQSRCLSWAITGPARFPVARAEKNHRYCEEKINRLCYFRENIERYLKKITAREETQDEKRARWVARIDFLKKYQDMMKDVNKMIRQGKIKEAEEKYNITLEKNCWGNYGFEGYHLSNNLANIHRLEEQVKMIDECRQKTDTGFEFDGGRVEYDPDEIRYNIFFDDIPDQDKRSKLKSHGFKWSPRRQAWTRGAKTININTIKSILGV